MRVLRAAAIVLTVGVLAAVGVGSSPARAAATGSFASVSLDKLADGYDFGANPVDTEPDNQIVG